MNDTRAHFTSSSILSKLPEQKVIPLSSRRLLTAPQDGWKKAVEERLQELVRLEHGWDGYNGIPVSFANAVFALRVMEAVCATDTPRPEIVPGVGGDLQIEWHTLLGDIELHVLGPNVVRAWRAVQDAPPVEDELHLTTDFRVIAHWIRDLTEPKIAAASAAA